MSAKRILTEYGALIALLVLLAVNVATRGLSFLQIANLRNLVSQGATVGVIAVGMTLVIIAGGIDLSVGSMTAMCGAVVILAVNKFAAMPPTEAILVATLASIGVGLLAGIFNGIVTAYGRVASFVVTLGVMAIGRRSVRSGPLSSG